MDAAHPDQAEDVSNRLRVPWLEERTADDPFRERPDPRIFGTHLPPDMLPHGVKAERVKVIYNSRVQRSDSAAIPQGIARTNTVFLFFLKVVYVWRNPKDILVSLYHFAHSWVLLETPRSFEDFFQQFLDGNGRFGTEGSVSLLFVYESYGG